VHLRHWICLAATTAAVLVLTGCSAGAPATSSVDTTSSPSTAKATAKSHAVKPRPAARAVKASPTDPSPVGGAAALLASLPVKGRAPMTGYDRELFGAPWTDVDGNGCDTRDDVLARDLSRPRYESGSGCVLATGKLPDPYTGSVVPFARGYGDLVDIDHVVSLGNAWVTGAFRWDAAKRLQLANDPANLLAVDASSNRQKGDGDAATWLPPNKSFRCEYIARQISVKATYRLWVTPPERAAMARVLATCPRQTVPNRHAAPPRLKLHVRSTPAPKPSSGGGSSTYFENCDAARAAGAAPVHRGDPGYSSRLDRDGDGTGCE
jgi:hypothetical protein